MDLDFLLYGNPSWEQVVEAFKEGDWPEESYLVDAIKKFLRTDGHRKLMYENDISIEDILNGRTTDLQVKHSICNDWNAKLGFKCFSKG